MYCICNCSIKHFLLCVGCYLNDEARPSENVLATVKHTKKEKHGRRWLQATFHEFFFNNYKL